MRIAAFITALALAVAFILSGGGADAGPFQRWRSCPPGQCGVSPSTSPTYITPSAESKEEDIPVQQPWLLISETGASSSQPPSIALEPVPGTGSRLPIGPKIPDNIGLKIDPATLDALKKLLPTIGQPTQPVAISLPMEEATSQRLSRILMILECLAWLGAGVFGTSSLGKVLPLVAQVAAGLQSATPAPSPAASPTAAAPSSPPANK